MDRLVSAGCRREVLYFCLEQLSPAAKEVQAGREWVSVPGKNDEPERAVKRFRELATKEDLEAVRNTTAKAMNLITRYRPELLLLAETKSPPVLSTLLSELRLTDADETFSLLLNLLGFVSELAKLYAAPFGKTLMKSKELLYLTLYVSTYADKKELQKSPYRAESEQPATRPRKEGRAKRDMLPDHALAHVASFCTGRHWAPSDLYATLRRFQKDHPSHYAQMAAKMAALHRNATK